MPRMLPKAILLDADGTLWRGGSVIPGAIEFISRAHSAGIRCLIISNNAGPDRESYLAKCAKLGLKFAEKDIFSVNHLAGPWLKANQSGKRILVVGSPLLVKNINRTLPVICADDWLEEKGAAEKPLTPDDLRLVNEANFDVVLIGIDASISYLKLALASVAVQRGAELVGANPDHSFPFEGGVQLPGNGSMVQLVASVASVVPEYLGKPSLHLLDQIESETGLNREEMIVIGDRVETDIVFAQNAGIHSYLVLTGVAPDGTGVSDMQSVSVAENLIDVAGRLEI